MLRSELVTTVLEIVNTTADDPAEEMIKQGKALQKIGEALKGQSPADARAAIKAVQQLV